MRIIYTFVFAVLLTSTAFSQGTPTWSDQIAQLVYEKCGYCHHPGGIAPFSLLNYTDAYNLRSMIQYDVTNKIMPPWPPNDSYQNYAHKRSLSQSQINLIVDWVSGGAPEGNPANTPAPPSYNQGSFLANPDQVLRAPVYTSKATTGDDDYVCFSIPTGLTNNKKVKAIEVVPGNPNIVHHCLVYADQTGSIATDTTGNCAGPSSAELIAGYAPGEFPTIFPNGQNVKMGVQLNAGSNLVLAMHYPAGSFGMIDSTKIHVYYYDDTVSNVRTVSANAILNDLSFCLSPNVVDTIYDVFPPSNPLPSNFTLISVFPHAHLLGREFLVYAVKLNGDTIPIIHIPRWDFHWQGFYLFKNPIKLPAGSRLYGGASYDNTSSNIHNPNNPPQTVCFGENTTDEMFLVYFQYLNYQPGDELLDLDSLTTPPNQSPTAVFNEAIGEHFLLAYPNPFDQQTNIEYYIENESEVHLQIYDINGRLVKNIVNNNLQQGRQTISWNGQNESGNDLSNGLYLIYLRAGDKISSRKILLNR